MRLDAASSSSFATSTPLVRRAQLGAAESAADTGPSEVTPAATPPPSLDGKGSLINTYA